MCHEHKLTHQCHHLSLRFLCNVISVDKRCVGFTVDNVMLVAKLNRIGVANTTKWFVWTEFVVFRITYVAVGVDELLWVQQCDQLTGTFNGGDEHRTYHIFQPLQHIFKRAHVILHLKVSKLTEVTLGFRFLCTITWQTTIHIAQ